MTLEELPPALTAQHIADYLGLARSTIYERYDMPVEVGGIPNFKVGNSRRTLKTDLIAWIENRKKEHQTEMDRRLSHIRGDKKGEKKVG